MTITSNVMNPGIQLTKDEMYQALLDRNSDWDGAFYIGVKTTGIFCRTVCTARKPKRENVDFYHNIQEAMAAGFRPCKICRPMESVGKIPEEIAALIAEVEANPEVKIKEGMLRERGIDPNTLRRWFKKHYQMSFNSFCRMHRISTAFGNIKEGVQVTSAAVNSGYESVSGFSDAFQKTMGSSPSQSKEKNILRYKRFDSPIGPMITVATDEGICLMEFGDRRMLETELADLQKRLKAVLLPGRNAHIDLAIEEINAYFEGSLKTFTVPLVTPGTVFQNQVWEALKSIPYGSLKSYQDQAAFIGNPKAVRAVGRANGMNRISIIIPCHRVLGTDGSLTGYGGGLWRKEWLLNHEKKNL